MRRPHLLLGPLAVASAVAFTMLAPINTAAETITPEPILEFVFQGDAEDQSANHLDGSLSGPTLINDRFGKPENTAYHFDGVDDFIDVPNTGGLLTLLDSWSLVVWVRPHAPGTDFRRDPILWKIATNGTNFDNYYVAWHTDSTFRAGLERSDNDGDLFVLSNPDQEVDAWHQIIAIYDESDLIMYVDGEEQGRTTIHDVTAYSGDAPLRIGNLLHSSHAQRGVFNGDIDDVRVFDRALSESEALRLWRNDNIPEPAILPILTLMALPLMFLRQRQTGGGNEGRPSGETL